jgi:lysozyme
VNNLVVYGNETDRRAAEYLSDALACSSIHGDKPFDYSTVENVYCVGGPGQLPFTAMAKKTITGKDRYDTCQQVLNFISNGCK